ncbi:MAG: ABC transporter substrate-binding protein [Pseudomonadota bacterium]
MKTVQLARRRLLGGTAVGLALGAIGITPALAQSKEIRIGYVSPQTGPLAAFGEADKWVIASLHDKFKAGVDIGGKLVPVRVILKDSQSSPNRAGEVANDLILKDKVDLMLVSSTPETANPVSDACELNEVPCISTVVPWQPWFFGRNGNPQAGFKWTYHMFWGLEDVIASFTHGWAKVATNKRVGGLFPNDGDGNAWGDKFLGFPRTLDELGYKLTDPGRYQNMNQDFSAQIAAFKKADVNIVTGVMIPPDAKTFLTQARQQGFRPKVVTLGKALLFPGAVEALGELGAGLSAEVWWSPSHPFKSSLTGARAAELCDAYEAQTGKQWTQPLGFSHALFEVALDALRRAHSTDRDALRAAIAATSMDSIVGPVKWGGRGPFKNVSKTPLVLGQWVKGKKFKYELVIVDNQGAPSVKTGGAIKLME